MHSARRDNTDTQRYARMFQLWERQDELALLREQRCKDILNKEEQKERKKEKILREKRKDLAEKNTARSNQIAEIKKNFQSIEKNIENTAMRDYRDHLNTLRENAQSARKR